jgi:hypothetical protein
MFLKSNLNCDMKSQSKANKKSLGPIVECTMIIKNHISNHENDSKDSLKSVEKNALKIDLI